MAEEQWITHALDSLAVRMRAMGVEPLGYRPNGRPIWPIMGAEDAPPGDGGDSGGDGGEGESGFPASTPIEQMTAPQREAYWKHQAQSWQSRAKGNYTQLQQLGIKNADDVATVKAKLDKHDQLEHDLMSTTERQVVDARAQAATEAASQFLPQTLDARLDAAAARAGVTDEAFANATKLFRDADGVFTPGAAELFLTDDGTIDTDKVKAFIDGIAPAMGNPQVIRRGPTATGHVTAGSGRPASGERGAAGKAEAQRRFGTKTA